MPVIFELKNVTFHYPNEEPVLNDINLCIGQGERLCVLGANGSGKSTLLKLLCGLIYPQKGSFEAFGEKVTERAAEDKKFIKKYHKRVGFIFQNPDTQLFCSTVLEEIAFGPLQMGITEDQVMERVNDVLEMLSIAHLKNKTPFKLSGGEKKKVALAATLAMNPEVLILDEPTNGLDPKTQRWLVGLLDSLNKAGKSVITSTHNLELVQEISDRSVVFSGDHRIAADTATKDLLEDIRLLQEVNLVDEYYHRHSDGGHAHYHMHNY